MLVSPRDHGDLPHAVFPIRMSRVIYVLYVSSPVFRKPCLRNFPRLQPICHAYGPHQVTRSTDWNRIHLPSVRYRWLTRRPSNTSQENATRTARTSRTNGGRGSRRGWGAAPMEKVPYTWYIHYYNRYFGLSRPLEIRK